MRLLQTSFAVAGFAFALAAGAGADAAQPTTVDAMVVLAADVSRSIDDGEFVLERQGYAPRSKARSS